MAEGSEQLFRKFLGQTAVTLLMTGVRLGVRLVKTVVYARLLSPEGRGVFGMAVTLPETLVHVGNGGLGTSAMFYMGQRRYSGGEALGTLTVAGLGLGAVLSLCGWAVARSGWLGAEMTEALEPYLLVVALGVPVFLYRLYLQDVMVGCGLVKETNTLRLLESLLLLALFLGWWAMGHEPLLSAMVATWATALTYTVLGYLALFRAGCWPMRVSLGFLREGLLYGLRVNLANIAHNFQMRANVFIVSWFLGAAALGHYVVAVALAELMLFVPQSVLLPFMATVFGLEKSQARVFTPGVHRLLLVAMVVFALGVALCAPWFVGLVYGKAFMDAVAPLRWMLPGVVGLSLFYVTKWQLLAQGKPGSLVAVSVAGMLVCIGLSIVLTPQWGLDGAALASSLAYGVSAMLASFCCIKGGGFGWRELFVPRWSDFSPIYAYVLRKMHLSR